MSDYAAGSLQAGIGAEKRKRGYAIQIQGETIYETLYLTVACLYHILKRFALKLFLNLTDMTIGGDCRQDIAGPAPANAKASPASVQSYLTTGAGPPYRTQPIGERCPGQLPAS